VSTPRHVWAIERGDAGYPQSLCDLDRPERPRLHGCGRRDVVAGLERHAAVTIVGTRRPSAYGLRVAERLGRELAAAGLVIVSGMARGIDAAAHRGALAARGTTIAVLANGPDVVYPPVNASLYERIIETGAAISEHPAGCEARRHHFPERNRIMAALGGAVLIVEAAQPSGTMITADRALRLGRNVGAIPGQVGVRVAAGPNDLIRDGAYLIRDARDVLDLVYGVGVEPRKAPTPRPGPTLDAALRALLDRVRSGSATVDRLALDGELEPREAAIGLARLELLGYVRADALGCYAPTDLAAP
jgi:DNA processing protein